MATKTRPKADDGEETGDHPAEFETPRALVRLTEDEAYLVAVLFDRSGIDLAELCWVDDVRTVYVDGERVPNRMYRCYPFQWMWWRCMDENQIDQGARCLQEGQLVLTARGWQPIEEVLVGDLVLTHRNRWRRVTNCWDRGMAEVVAVAGQGPAKPLVMTPTHKLWARHAVRASKPRDGHRGKKLLEAGWARADELRMNDGSQVMATNWASPAQVAPLPLPPPLEPAYRSGPQNLVADLWTEQWMWLYGLFLAEGSTYIDDRHARATWSVHEDEAAEVGAALTAVGLNFHEDRHADGAVVSLVVNSRPLALWLRQHAGHLAHNKEIAPWAYGLSADLRQAIYEGMVFGDGGHRGRRDSYTTASRKLLLGFRVLAQSLGRSVSTWAGRAEGATSILRGREVTRRASWSAECQPIEGQSRGKVKIEDGLAWAPVNSVSPAGTAHVWDIEVEEDHSFVCEGIVVHNSLGKALAVDTPIPTRHGWKRMGDLVVGDVLFDRDGRPTVVTDAFEVRGDRPCYQVTFDNRTSIVADADHRWVTKTQADRLAGRPASVRTTEQIAQTVIAQGTRNHSIDVAGNLTPRDTRRSYAVEPYTLGAWLGDGSSYRAHITAFGDDGEFITNQIRAEGYEVAPLGAEHAFSIRRPGQGASKRASVTHSLRGLGLIGAKHIPREYQRADTNQRRALLQGLMDTDGHITKAGRCEITFKSERLARDIYELVVGLRQKAYFEERRATCNGVDAGPVYRVGFHPHRLVPFRLPRKVARVRPARRAPGQHRVVSVERVESVPVRCIAVDSPTRTFLAGEAMIPTHNSESIIAQASAFPFSFPGQEFLIITPEGSHADALTERLEPRLFGCRLTREMLAAGGGRRGVTHHPFQANYANGARVMVRLPQTSGIGVKGCVAAGALVLTRGRGLVPIEDVVVGDEVRTHEHRWMPVLEVESFEDDVFEVRGPGSFPVLANGHHHVRGRWDESRQPGKSRRALGQTTWGYVDDLAAIEGRINFYWQGPSVGAWSDVEPPPGPVGGWDLARPEAWWLIGRWLADGCVGGGPARGDRPGVIWLATPAQSPEISDRLDALGRRWHRTVRHHSAADRIVHSNLALSRWLTSNFGHLADGKGLPGFAFTLPAELRAELLAGYLSGDGCATRPDRVVAGSASKRLAVGMGILAQGLGRSVGFTQATPRHTHVMGVELKSPPKTSYRVNVSTPGHGKGIHDAAGANYKVRSVTPAGRATVYNLVTGDHSYLADGIYHHNTHPVVLHIDEAQDISKRTWDEIPEIVRQEVEGHQTRAHGVSRGVRDDVFFQKTKPDSGWTVHRLTRMHNTNLEPYRFYDAEGRELSFTTNDLARAERYAAKHGCTFTENWRDKQAREYGGRNAPAFMRNVYGLHGDAMNRVFKLTRLSACFDTVAPSRYNQEEYRFHKIDADIVAGLAERASGREHDVEVYDDVQAQVLLDLVEIPPSHLADYDTFWCGMDVGIIGDPSEILVFAEYLPSAAERKAAEVNGYAIPPPGVTRLKLLLRIQLNSVEPELQAKLIMHLIGHYKPRAFSMDQTGNGIAILRALQRMAGTARVYVHEDAEAPMLLNEEGQRKAREALTHIKGYNFGAKIVIEIDERIVEERGLTDPQEILDQAGIRQNVKDAATDVLREWVDTQRAFFPDDSEVKSQMNAATEAVTSAEPYDQYGRPRRRDYGQGEFHVLDAARMAALGYDKQLIEAIEAETREPAEPIYDRFGF